VKEKLQQAYQALMTANVTSTVGEGRKLAVAAALLEQCLQELEPTQQVNGAVVEEQPAA
jgi:hypothetical protein